MITREVGRVEEPPLDVGMRLLCSKIHPLCYARMLQTMSDYALGVSLLCS